jgi:ferredoxin/DMSO/TMAO reductase YedYZ heme-binding membrane subunit
LNSSAVETSLVVHSIGHTLGFSSYILLFAAVCYGIVLRAGWALTRFKHATIYGTHMTLVLLGLNLGVVHGIAQMFNPIGTIGVIQVVVPFVDPTDPIGVGFGVIATELMLALTFSILIQKKLGYSKWRALHSLAYASYTLLTAHLLISGRHVLPVPAVWIPVVISQVVVIGLWIFTSSQVSGNTRRMGERVGSRLRAQQATVNVDPGRCVRFGFCEHEAPQVFQLRSDGRLAYQPQVPADEIDNVIQAAKICPARAIMLTRTATTVVMQNPEEEQGSDEPPRPTSRPEPRTTAIPRVDRVREERARSEAPPRDERPARETRDERPRSAPRADGPRAVPDPPRGLPSADRPRGVPSADRPRAVPRIDERPAREERVPRVDRPRAVPRGEDRSPRVVPREGAGAGRPTRLAARRGGSRHGKEE